MALRREAASSFTRGLLGSGAGGPATIEQEEQSVDGVAQRQCLLHAGVEQGVACAERGARAAGGRLQIDAVAVLERRNERLEERQPAPLVERPERIEHGAGAPRDDERGFVQLRILPPWRFRSAPGGSRGAPAGRHARPGGAGNGGTTPLPCPLLRSTVSVMRFRSDPATRMRSE